MPTLTSSFIGTNRLLYLIRSGRYCQVWAAIDDSRGRKFALKFLLPEFRRDRDQLALLRNEYEIGSKLNHPSLLGAFRMADGEVGPYLAMELFVGLNLRDVLHETWKEIKALLPTIIAQTAESVARLHDAGFVHLDLKPDNYMVNENGEVRLIDFALARRPPNAWERYFWKSRQKSIQGTRSYLSPEQIRRDPVDRRSDVYGLGCTFYHLASNVPPYTAPTSNELLTKHLHYPPPSLEVDNPDVTPQFAQLVARMMAKKPQDRPASADEVFQALKTTPVFKDEEAPPKPSRKSAAK